MAATDQTEKQFTPAQTATQVNETDDINIKQINPLIPPAILMENLPLTRRAAATVLKARTEIANILSGADPRLLVIVGPCSIHDPKAARDYAKLLLPIAEQFKDDLLILMRVYFEKPRTTVGWKGLINDPYLDGSYQINKGLHIARQLLLDINELGLPAGVEFLDTISPQFIGDLVAWGAIGARTTESQVHRELASGLSCPVGFKNGTTGSVDICAAAIAASSHKHHFLSVTKQGLAAIVETKGNRNTHTILRGGIDSPNFDAASIAQAHAVLNKAGVCDKIMVDCSHGNSMKVHTNQVIVAENVASQVAFGNKGIVGVMIEGNHHGGRQDIPEDPSKLQYGVSVTDACLSWEETLPCFQRLAEASRARRAVKGDRRYRAKL